MCCNAAGAGVTLSYGMADKDTHPHHYPSSSPAHSSHSLPSSSSTGAAPPTSTTAAVASASAPPRQRLPKHAAAAAAIPAPPGRGISAGKTNLGVNHRGGQRPGLDLRHTQPVLVNQRQNLVRQGQIVARQPAGEHNLLRQEKANGEHNLSRQGQGVSKLEQILPRQGQNLSKQQLPEQNLSRQGQNLSKQPSQEQNLSRQAHNPARPPSLEKKLAWQGQNLPKQPSEEPAPGQNLANHKHGSAKLPKKAVPSIQQPIEGKKPSASPLSPPKPVTRPRSSRDDEGSPKKKQLKLILKLRKPHDELPPPPPPPHPPAQGVGVRSKAAAPNGSLGLGSSSSSRQQHLPEARSNGTTGARTGGSMENHHQRTPAGVTSTGSATAVATTTTTSASASASESMEDEGLQQLQHHPRKRKFREEDTSGLDGATDDVPKRRMKEKDGRFVPALVSGSLENGSPPYQVMEELLERFQKKDTYGVFAEPVDPEEIPDYLDVIKEPMDFSTIKKKLAKGAYGSIELFERDVILICSNAMKYNAPRTIYYKQAKAIKDIARKAFDVLKGRLNGQRRGPGKHSKLKRMATRQQGPDATAAAALSDAKMVSTIDRVADFSHKSNSPFQSSGNDFEIAEGSLSKAVSLKDGRRLLTVDENRRHTYRPPEPVDDAVIAQLVPFGVNYGCSYAQSLALFGANFKRPAWDFVAKKIRKVLAPNVPFGPGWVGEQDKPDNTRLDSLRQQRVTQELTRDDPKEKPASKEIPAPGVPPASLQLPFRSVLGSTSTPSAPNGMFPVTDVHHRHQQQQQQQQLQQQHQQNRQQNQSQQQHQHHLPQQQQPQPQAPSQQQQQQQQQQSRNGVQSLRIVEPQQQQQQPLKTPPSRFPLPTENLQDTGRYPVSAPPKFGPNGSVGYTGLDTSRSSWSLQKALNSQQEATGRENITGGLQRVFGQEHGNPGRSNGETAAAAAAAFPSNLSAAAFQNLSSYSNSSSNSSVGPLFGLAGLSGQGMMAKQSPAAATAPQQPMLRPDINASSAEFFRQQSDFQPMGVYNAISQSLLQPWKTQRFQQQQQQQHPHLQQHQLPQQQQQQHQLRPLPPDLNVRLQSPKSPQHQSQHLQSLQQHHQHHQQQHQQQQQQQQLQQPDLALQL